jgi:type VI secretion system secreted protein Hcp
MAVDMFLKLDTVDGESVDHAHADEIDILSYSFAAHQTGTSNTGGGSGAGRVSVQDITVTKKVDKSSPMLFLLCCNGKMLTKGFITIRKAGGDALEYLIVSLEDILITGYQTTGSDGQDQIVEQVTLNFKRCGIIYTPQLDDGTGGAVVDEGWNIAKNEPWEPSKP